MNTHNSTNEMISSKAGKVKKVVSIITLVLIASIVAILSKNLLPSDVNVSDFDSIFVKTLSFPVVASMYFVMIYTHNALATELLVNKSKLSNIQVGWRLGICFALIYLVGMQEVVVAASPFTKWGFPFVLYQFIMGIGEAVAALLLCLVIAKFVNHKKDDTVEVPVLKNKFLLMLLITLAYTLERTFACETGFIASDVNTFPVPHYLWTVIFGIVLSFGLITILPIFCTKDVSVWTCVNSVVLTMGLSWMIFNLFIGLIFKDSIYDVLIRSSLDVAAVFLACLLWLKLTNAKG